MCGAEVASSLGLSPWVWSPWWSPWWSCWALSPKPPPPPGYGPPGYPGGYYPGPDYGGYPPQPPLLGGQPGTNGLAIASLIASFTGLLCGIGSVVAIVLGAIALDQIKRTRQDGFGLAVAGIVIGIATLVVTLVVVLFALHTH
ncbi:DUF4190 domain-containing protein [Mycobacterium avium subsp. paratuberculosis]|nr:DUF4190 domain-containing protein [Mycobacterium avium subsp. paratuberculosis]